MGIAKRVIHRFWPVGILLALWLLFCAPYLFGGNIPYPSSYQASFFPPWSAQYGMAVKNNAMPDIITQIYPWKVLTIESWKQGQVPLWNPYSFGGTPHAANYQTAVFSPFNLLFFVLPQMSAWTVLILLQPLLAGLFMYLFLGTVVKKQAARVIGSIAFMFCGFLVVWMAYGTLGYAALFLPLILWGIRTYKKTGSFRAGAAVALGLGLSFVSGHFQISLYVLAATIAWLIFEKGRAWMFVLLGLLLASPQLLLSYDAYQASVRSGLFLRGEVIPWQYLVTLLAPDFYGNPVTRNDWFGHYAEWAGFIGVVPLLLALWAALSVRTREVLFFSGLALFAILLATPTPLLDLLYLAKIPVLSTSAASRIIILFCFAASVLSAVGLESLSDDWKKKTQNNSFRFAGGIGVFLLVLWGLLLGGNVLPADKISIAVRNFILPSALMGIAGAVIMAGFGRKRWFQCVLVGLLILLSGADSLRFVAKWMPADPKEFAYPPMQIVSELTKRVGIDRVIGEYGAELALPFHVQSLEGYDALYQGRYGEFIMSANTGTPVQPGRSVVEVGTLGTHAEKLLSLTGARYVLHRKSDGRNSWAYPVWEYAHYRKAYEDEYYELYENTNALPRAFLASSYQVEQDPARIAQILWSDEFDHADTLVLEAQPAYEPAMASGAATVEYYTPRQVRIRTVSDGAALLFLSDVYDAGWQASIDGRPAEVQRANYAFRAVAVPAGEHIVAMSYEPRGWATGRYLAAGALVILIALGMKQYYEYRYLRSIS